MLKKQLSIAGLAPRDAALATNLCFGVVQNELLLDFYLTHFSKIPLSRMESKVLAALQVGAYQILFLDKIPHSAAVNSAVTLTKKHSKNPKAAGMVNGILRSLLRSIHDLPRLPEEDPIQYLSIRYSHPVWLVKTMVQRFGKDQAEALLKANNAQPPMTVMVNTLKTDADTLVAALEADGVLVQRHDWLENCLILRGTGNLETLYAFQQGLFYIQDPASRLAVMASGVAAGLRVLDTCAAPGGKSFAAGLAMKNRGSIYACDLHPHKKTLIENSAQRLGLTLIQSETIDARQFRPEWEDAFDVVIVDAPCSGLGVIRKKPDIRSKNPEQLKALPGIQREIISNAARYVKADGVLLYSTCTILTQENEAVVQDFLTGHPEFQLEEFSLPEPIGTVECGMITLLPHIHETDGFFFARLRKRSLADTGDPQS